MIFASGDAAATAAKDATSTIPIVFVSGDPVGQGLVDGLARPGGSLTGVSILTFELMPKRLELLSELVPQAGVIALLANPNTPGAERMIRDVQEAARVKGLQLVILPASNARSTPPTPPSPNCKPVRSLSAAMRSSTAGASNSWRWRHVMPFRRCISCVSSPRLAA